jgi:N6-adenosine-specific RNA methylase IME4
MTYSYVEPGLFDGAKAVSAWPFGSLSPRSYHLIMADPPWHFEVRSEKGEEKSPQAQYSTMSLSDIAALPVADLAAEDCLLWLWATAPLLPQQLEIMAAWGFRFLTTGVWVKTTKTGKLAFGTGYYLRNAHEPFLIGARGSPERVPNVRSVVMAEAREHSRKPDEAFAAAEKMRPAVVNPRRCELFSRESRPGWETWGNEAGKFDREAA